MSKIYFTITGTSFRYGSEFMERGMRVKLVKEPDNKVDSEAIRVEMPGLGKIGYVANSVRTVLGKSMSAGRLYDKIGDKAGGKVLYIMEEGVVAVLDEGAATYKEGSGSNGASKENDDNNDDDGDGEDDDDEDFIDVILNLKIGEPIEEEEYEEESEEDNYKDYDYGDDEDVKDEENEDGEEYEDESKYEDGGAAKAGLGSGNNNHGSDYVNFNSDCSGSAGDDFDEVAMMGLMPGINVGMPGGGDFGGGGGFGGF